LSNNSNNEDAPKKVQQVAELVDQPTEIREYQRLLGIPISQGSLAKMQRWFTHSLEPSYEQWLAYVKEPGVRCVDETTYCIDGIKYWLWVATSNEVCVLLLAPAIGMSGLPF
jgi:hypothetical protein